MTPSEILIAVAAWIQAIAAIAMWKATINLVRTSRDMILADVEPRVRVYLGHSQPFCAPKHSVMVIKNDGSVQLKSVKLQVGPSFASNNGNAYSKITSTLAIGTLKAGKEYKFRLWEYAQAAAHKKDQLPDDFSRARDSPNAPVEVFLS